MRERTKIKANSGNKSILINISGYYPSSWSLRFMMFKIQRHNFTKSITSAHSTIPHPLCAIFSFFTSIICSVTWRPWISKVTMAYSPATSTPPTVTKYLLSLCDTSILLPSSWERLTIKSSAPPWVQLPVCLSTISANSLWLSSLSEKPGKDL